MKRQIAGHAKRQRRRKCAVSRTGCFPQQSCHQLTWVEAADVQDVIYIAATMVLMTFCK